MIADSGPDGFSSESTASPGRLVPVAGIALLLLALGLAGLFPSRTDIVIIAIALAGIGVTTIGFWFLQRGLLRTGTRLEKIKQEQARFQALLNRIRK